MTTHKKASVIGSSGRQTLLRGCLQSRASQPAQHRSNANRIREKEALNRLQVPRLNSLDEFVKFAPRHVGVYTPAPTADHSDQTVSIPIAYQLVNVVWM